MVQETYTTGGKTYTLSDLPEEQASVVRNWGWDTWARDYAPEEETETVSYVEGYYQPNPYTMEYIEPGVYRDPATGQYYADPYGENPISYAPTSTAKKQMVTVEDGVYQDLSTGKYYSDPEGTQRISYDPGVTRDKPTGDLISNATGTTTGTTTTSQGTSTSLPGEGTTDIDQEKAIDKYTQYTKAQAQISEMESQISEQERKVQEAEEQRRKTLRELNRQRDMVVGSPEGSTFYLELDGKKRQYTREEVIEWIEAQIKMVEEQGEQIQEAQTVIRKNKEAVKKAKEKVASGEAFKEKPVGEFKTAEQLQKEDRTFSLTQALADFLGPSGKMERGKLGTVRPEETQQGRIASAGAGVLNFVLMENLASTVWRGSFEIANRVEKALGFQERAEVMGVGDQYATYKKAQADFTENWRPEEAQVSKNIEYKLVVGLGVTATLLWPREYMIKGVFEAPEILDTANYGTIQPTGEGEATVGGIMSTELTPEEYVVTTYGGTGRSKTTHEIMAEYIMPEESIIMEGGAKAYESLDYGAGKVVDSRKFFFAEEQAFTGAESYLVKKVGKEWVATPLDRSISASSGESLFTKVGQKIYGQARYELAGTLPSGEKLGAKGLGLFAESKAQVTAWDVVKSTDDDVILNVLSKYRKVGPGGGTIDLTKTVAGKTITEPSILATTTGKPPTYYSPFTGKMFGVPSAPSLSLGTKAQASITRPSLENAMAQHLKAVTSQRQPPTRGTPWPLVTGAITGEEARRRPGRIDRVPTRPPTLPDIAEISRSDIGIDQRIGRIAGLRRATATDTVQEKDFKIKPIQGVGSMSGQQTDEFNITTTIQQPGQIEDIETRTLPLQSIRGITTTPPPPPSTPNMPPIPPLLTGGTKPAQRKKKRSEFEIFKIPRGIL